MKKPIVVININPSAKTRSGTRKLVRVFQRLSNHPVLERHFKQLTLVKLRQLSPAATIVGPQGVPFDAYEQHWRDHLFHLLRHLSEPALAVCGGHQALVLAYDGHISPVHGGHASKQYGGLKKERGYKTVEPKKDNPLITTEGQYFASHVEGVSRLPDNFELIATGRTCEVQAVRLKGNAVFGVQFHPEKGGAGIPMLRRFLALSGINTEPQTH